LTMNLSRRGFSRFLGVSAFSCATLAALSPYSRQALANSVVSARPGKPETETLVQYAYFLVPVLDPGHERYRAVADKVSALASQVPPIAGLLAEGIEALNGSGAGQWLKLTPGQRSEIVQAQEGTPFFGFMRWNTSEIVMRDPQLWKVLGYQGSAIERGGYINGGFDDIDWLPGQKVGAEK
jgi:hypothetical protein